jgi:uncharacterized protein YlxW (UPF0749 family)
VGDAVAAWSSENGSPKNRMKWVNSAKSATGSLSWTVVVLGVMAVVMAFWLVQEVRVQDLLQQTVALREGEILSSLLEQTYSRNNALETRLAAIQAALKGPWPVDAREAADLQAARVAAGLTPVTGSGVVVTLMDSPTPRYPGEPAEFQIVHDQYVLHIVGLLVGAGAKAVAINGQRFVATTAVFCAGPTIRVNGVNEGAPFVVEAVGPITPMLTALETDPDVQGWSQLVQLHYRAVRRIQAPALAHPPTFSLARPLPITTLGG